MSAYEDQLRRDAAAITDALERALDGAMDPLLAHAERLHQMASELSQLSGRPNHEVGAEGLRDLAGDLQEMSRQSAEDLQRLKSELIQAMRAQAIANRRRSRRVDTDIPAEVEIQAGTLSTRVINLSLGGARIEAAVNSSVGTPALLRLTGLARPLPGEVVHVSEEGTQLRFILADPVADELGRMLERIAS